MTTTPTEEVCSAIQDRTEAYRFLARLYRIEADEDLLGIITNLEIALEDNDTGSEMTEGAKLWWEYLGQSKPNMLLDLARDYAKVFCGACSTRGQSAYPFESVYTSEERLLMQDARDEVIEQYRAAGFMAKESWHEPEDHIALELEFMARLSEQTFDALKKGEPDTADALLRWQSEFLEQHLLNWVPAFVEDIARLASTDFYRGLALITSGFLSADFEFLSAALAEEESGAMAL